MKPINSTTIQKYYRALSALFNWSVNEGILETSSLVKIKVPRAEKKVVKSLSSTEANQLILHFGDSFDGVRNKAIILVLVDCGLRLGELLNLKLFNSGNVGFEQTERCGHGVHSLLNGKHNSVVFTPPAIKTSVNCKSCAIVVSSLWRAIGLKLEYLVRRIQQIC